MNKSSPNENSYTTSSIIDEDYLINLHNHLKDMKKIRQQVEEDANLLDGRLRCLRDEEKKTRMKIIQLHKKESFLKKQRDEQQAKIKEKELLQQQRNQRLLEREQLNKLRKDINKEAVRLKKEEKRKQVEDDVKSFKEQRKANEEIKMYSNLEERNTKKNKVDYIRHQQELAVEKRRAGDLEKKKKIKEELMRRIEEERNKIVIAESKKGILEQEENDIIKQLNITTKTHKDLVDNYDKLGNEELFNKQNK